LACAVAIEFLDALDGLLDHVREIGNYFHGQLRELKEKHDCIREVRGLGLMLAIELDSANTAKAVVSTLLANKILINRTHETVLRFLPPYIIQEKHVDAVIRALDSTLTVTRQRAARHAVNLIQKRTVKESK